MSHLTLNQFTGLDLSPDGKKIALIAHRRHFRGLGPRWRRSRACYADARAGIRRLHGRPIRRALSM